MHKRAMNRVRTTLYIDKPPYEALSAEAAETGDSINGHVVGILLDYLREKEIHHYIIFEDKVVLWDSNIMELAAVYFTKGGGFSCSVCLKSDCRHVDFAMRIPEIQKMLAAKEG